MFALEDSNEDTKTQISENSITVKHNNVEVQDGGGTFSCLNMVYGVALNKMIIWHCQSVHDTQNNPATVNLLLTETLKLFLERL